MEQDINLSTLISLSGDEYAYYPLHSRNQPDGCEVVQIYKILQTNWKDLYFICNLGVDILFSFIVLAVSSKELGSKNVAFRVFSLYLCRELFSFEK